MKVRILFRFWATKNLWCSLIIRALSMKSFVSPEQIVWAIWQTNFIRVEWIGTYHVHAFRHTPLGTGFPCPWDKFNLKKTFLTQYLQHTYWILKIIAPFSISTFNIVIFTPTCHTLMGLEPRAAHNIARLVENFRLFKVWNLVHYNSPIMNHGVKICGVVRPFPYPK